MNRSSRTTGLFLLVVVSSQAAGVRLPARSESRFHKSWGCFVRSEGLLAIEQIRDSILIQVFGGGMPGQPAEYQADMREGRIAIPEFRAFWDSLDLLGFWRLRDEYSGRAKMTGEERGSISVSFEHLHGGQTSKTIRYFVPRSCTLEFRRVYDLFVNMARYAPAVPDWRTLLRYDTAPPIKEFKNRYHSAALRAIAAIRDSQDLDTLLTMLLADNQYSGAVIAALGNIGSKRVVPVLEEFLATQAVKADREGARYEEGNAAAAAKVLVAANGRQSLPTIRRYLDATYNSSRVYTWVSLLASVGDYSLVPDVVQILSDSSRYRREYVSRAAGTLERIGYRSQVVISALFLETERELKKPEPDNGTVTAMLSTLRALTGQELAYHPEDSLSVTRSSLARWLEWWTANARSFLAGNEGGSADGYGFLRVSSKPSGAAISLDTTGTGTTAPFLLLNVAAGEHDLRLTKEGYADWSASVTVAQARTTTVDAVLQESFGRILVTSSPSGAAISLDGSNTGTSTPRLFSDVATGRHHLGLTKTGYPGWDSTVVVTQGQATTVNGILKPPPDSLWIAYAGSQVAGWVILKGPERAVRFDPRPGFGYPLRITKVSAVFHVLRVRPWPDSSFRFKIYRGDGQTLLYESPVLEAAPGEPGPAVVHELSDPIPVDSGEFYVSVAPLDSSGMPSSLAWSEYSEWRVPFGIAEDSSNKRSYSGSPGHWSPLEKGELSLFVLVRR